MSASEPDHLRALRSLLGDLAGQDLSSVDPGSCFLDLGFDSLFLTQAASALKTRFGVKVTFRQLLEELTTLEKLAAYLAAHAPAPCSAPLPGKSSKPLPPVASSTTRAEHRPLPIENPVSSLAPTVPTVQPTGLTSTVLDRVIREQLRIMEQQLMLVRNSTPQAFAVPIPGSKETPQSQAQQPAVVQEVPPPVAEMPSPGSTQHGPFKPLDKGAKGGLTDLQQAHLDWVIARYTSQTPASKAYAQKYRSRLADPRAVAGFKLNWKEMVYPIVTQRSAGAYLWDLDGNRWVDVTMGFGVALLGHSPPFLTEAIKQQLDLGVEIGPQSPLAGEVADLICEMTGMERVTFCNTGSEAVMAALRICRTVTGRTRVVLFSGAYHGTFDEVLVKGTWKDGEPRTLPLAPGVAPNLVAEVTVLEYGSQRSLDWIRENAGSLAAVLVETVQSRHPDLQPREFLHEIRRITQQSETPLIFDEVITGFRCDPGGAQKVFGIEADLATYGKIVGGGMPFGFIAGKAWLMDAFDGGFWQFGDNSFPQTGVTFFAGTFVRHPLAMAAARVILRHLKEGGAEIQNSITRKTDSLIGDLNAYFQQHQIPIHLERFTSVWYPHFGAEVKHGSLLYYHLREKGLHIWEGRPCFLSTAHSDEDLAFIARAFKLSVAEMQKGGFLSGSSAAEFESEARRRKEGTVGGAQSSCGTSQDSRRTAGSPEPFPVTVAQREMWVSTQFNPDASGAFNALLVIELNGTFVEEAFEQAVQEVVNRHEALRAFFDANGEMIQIASHLRARAVVHNYRDLPPHEREPRLNAFLEAEARHLFDLCSAPLFRFHLIALDLRKHVVVFHVNMSVCDGWSINLILEELGEIYSAKVEGRAPKLQEVLPMRRYQEWLAEEPQMQAGVQAEDFWVKVHRDPATPARLPFTHPHSVRRTYRASRETAHISTPEFEGLKKSARATGVTTFAFLLAAAQAWMARLSGSGDTTLAVPFAGQAAMGNVPLAGQCVHSLPVRCRQSLQASFSDWVKDARTAVLDAQENWCAGFGNISQRLGRRASPGELPLAPVLFNLDPPLSSVHFSGLNHAVRSGPRAYFQYDAGLNVLEDRSGLTVELDYNAALLSHIDARNWLKGFLAVLRAAVDNTTLPVADLHAPELSGLPITASRASSDQERASTRSNVRASQAPQTPCEIRLARLWKEVLAVEHVGVDDHFLEIGGSSLAAASLFKAIEKEFGKRVPLSQLLQTPTLGSLAAVLEPGGRKAEVDWSPLVPIQMLGEKRPLFLAHGAGGNVLLYRALARRLAPEQPVYGLQSVGLDGKTAPLATIEAMAAEYLRHVRKVQPEGPYLLGGYCMGGTLAYEMAQQLKAAGADVRLVAMMDTYNWVEAGVSGGFRSALERFYFHAGNFWRLPSSLRQEYIQEKWRVLREGEWRNLLGRQEAGDRPEGADEPRIAPVQASNDEACLAYRPRPLAVPLTLIVPQRNYHAYPDPMMGFAGLAQAGIERHELPMNPHAMLVEPFVEHLASALRSSIESALRTSPADSRQAA